jgi:hypothetical protein
VKIDWKQTLATVAPMLGTALGGPLGGLAAKAIADKVLGKPDATEDEIAAAVASGDPKTLLALKEAEQSFLTTMRELGIKEEQLHAEDRASARQREVQTGDSATPRVLAAVAVIGFFGVLGGVLWQGLPDGSGGNVLMLLIGTLTAVVMAVFNYYFGSSSGSKAKDSAMLKGAK